MTIRKDEELLNDVVKDKDIMYKMFVFVLTMDVVATWTNNSLTRQSGEYA